MNLYNNMKYFTSKELDILKNYSNISNILLNYDQDMLEFYKNSLAKRLSKIDINDSKKTNAELNSFLEEITYLIRDSIEDDPSNLEICEVLKKLVEMNYFNVYSKVGMVRGNDSDKLLPNEISYNYYMCEQAIQILEEMLMHLKR